MVEHRSSAALSAFLMSQPHKWRRGVKVVVTDGSRTYKASVDACLPCARHVLDRFHVIRWFCAGLTAARRDIQRREPHGVKPAFDPEVFRARFLLLRRGDTLTGADQARLDALFDTHPAAQSRLAGPTGAPRPLHRRRPPRRPGGPGAVLRPLRDRRAARVPQHRRHLHRLVRRDPQLAPHRPGQQRTHRGHQPAPSSAAHRPRLHQPSQLRSPRTADNTTRQPVPATLHPTLTRRARFRVDRPFQASMEGRAIARPNSSTPRRTCSLRERFNGGPGNCPAKQQTVCAIERRLITMTSFNGGPGNCPAKQRVVTWSTT